MAEILPDGSFQNYFRQCKICGKTVETNIQGDELGKHTCGKVVSSLEDVDWDEVYKMKDSRSGLKPKPVWAEDKVFEDFFGNQIKVGDRVLRFDTEEATYKAGTVKQINLCSRWSPLGVLTDDKAKIGWTTPKRVIVQASFKVVV